MKAVTSISWISRGLSKRHPETVELKAEQLKKLIQSKGGGGNDSVSDDDDDVGGGGLSVYNKNEDDPYLSKDNADDDDDDDEVEITNQDNVIAVGKVSDDEFSLEAWVYNESKKTVYCHHDYILSSCPLAVEWVGPGGGGASGGNIVAVGTMEPVIELWDFDVMNTIDPKATLGGSRTDAKKGKKKRKMGEGEGHDDAVLALSWNRLRGNVLASGSADSRTGIWDLTSNSCVVARRHHSDKVQTVQWHPFESELLLSGSFDRTTKVLDCRVSDDDETPKSWRLKGEVEKVVWDRHNPFCFFASTDKGKVYYFDIRSDNAVFKFSAHKSAVTGLNLSPTVAGCLITSSEDEAVKVWDARSTSDKPKLVSKKACGIGALFSSAICSDSPFLVCVGGKNETRVIDLKINENVASCFNTTRPTSAKKEDVDDKEEDEEEDEVGAEEEEEGGSDSVAVEKIGKRGKNGTVKNKSSKKIKMSDDEEEEKLKSVSILNKKEKKLKKTK